jgi:hypothetical protein
MSAFWFHQPRLTGEVAGLEAIVSVEDGDTAPVRPRKRRIALCCSASILREGDDGNSKVPRELIPHEFARAICGRIIHYEDLAAHAHLSRAEESAREMNGTVKMPRPLLLLTELNL